jgi:hypothetical protein
MLSCLQTLTEMERRHFLASLLLRVPRPAVTIRRHLHWWESHKKCITAERLTAEGSCSVKPVSIHFSGQKAIPCEQVGRENTARKENES